MHQYRIGLVFSYLLGHITHQKNLEPYVEGDQSLDPSWMPLPARAGDVWDAMPVVRNHLPLRLSLRARTAIKAARRDGEFDVLFYHTPISAMLGVQLARRVPTVLSLDATPIDFAGFGPYHRGSKPRKANRTGFKFRWSQAVFKSASALIAWSAWCKRSLVGDYGVEESNVSVIPPGVDLSQWTPRPRWSGSQKKLQLLFVGGDFKRKGGHVVLEAYRNGMSDYCEIDIVSRGAPPGDGGVRVHHDMQPNSPELHRLYANADVFILPSCADCNSIATMEAMASGLPAVITTVGGLPELVEEGRTGFLIAPGDANALTAAVKALAMNSFRRADMARAARAHAEKYFDAGRNYPAVLSVLKRCADAARGGVRLPQVPAIARETRRPAA